jgi:hypothetical protein
MANAMTMEEILKALDELPDDATIEDAMEHHYFLFRTEQDLRRIEEGNTFNLEEVEARNEFMMAEVRSR